jgi:hypothetical protein
MKSLKPDGRIDLEHPAYCLRGSPENSAIVVSSEDGHVSLLDLGSNTAKLQRPTTKLRAISPHPTELLLAYTDGNTGALLVRTSTGELVAEVNPPSPAAGASKSIARGFDDCYFDESGDCLWLVAPVSDNECELSLVETKGWSVVQRETLEDRFGTSSFSFHSTGKSDLLVFWIAAGQDGQEVYWLRRNSNTFSLVKVDEMTNCIPPVFSPDGSEILVLDEDSAICRYAFTGMKQLGSPLESGDEDNPFDTSLCFLDDYHAIAGTGEGRVFLVDTKILRIDEEIAIEGHEPRPIGEYYQNLTNERGLGTDITWFTRLGSVIFFVFRRDRGTELKGWKDSLLWYSATR